MQTWDDMRFSGLTATFLKGSERQCSLTVSSIGDATSKTLLYSELPWIP